MSHSMMSAASLKADYLGALERSGVTTATKESGAQR